MRRPRPRGVLVVLALVGMSASFMQMLVIPIQARLPQLLDADKADASWVVTATLLTSAVITPIAGRLGDLYGKRRVLLALLGLLIAGSVIAALSSSIEGVIVGRALQGAAVGAVSLGLAILRDVYPPARLGFAVALVSATLGIGGSIGLPVAAIIAQSFEWHVIFWMSAILATVVFVLVVLAIPASVLRSCGRFDYVGSFGLALGLVGVLLAVTKGAAWGWASSPTIACGAGGTVVLVLWTIYELRRDSPLVDIRVAVRRTATFANLATIGSGFALFAFNVAVPQLLEAPSGTVGHEGARPGNGFGLSLVETSLMILVSGVVMVIASPVVGRLERRLGARTFLVAGVLLVAAAFAFVLLATRLWQIVAGSILVGLGTASTLAVLPILIMGTAPASETAAANALNTLMRSLGQTAAAAVIGTILAGAMITKHIAETPSPTDFRIAFAVAGAAALLSVAPALLIPRRRIGRDGTPASSAAGVEEP